MGKAKVLGQIDIKKFKATQQRPDQAWKLMSKIERLTNNRWLDVETADEYLHKARSAKGDVAVLQYIYNDLSAYIKGIQKAYGN